MELDILLLKLVPGQKQWQVIDIKGVWGEVRKPGIAHGMSSAAQPKVKASAVQILGKERAPQVDDAASAIATQLEEGIDGGISGLNHNLSEPCSKKNEIHKYIFMSCLKGAFHARVIFKKFIPK